LAGNGKKSLRETADALLAKLPLARKATARGYAESSFTFTMTLANVIQTHEHAGDFKEP